MALTACTVETKQQAPTLQPITVSAGTPTKPIAFSKLDIRIPLTEPIGTIQTGGYCQDSEDLKLRGGRFSLDGEGFDQVFIEAATRAGYRIVGDPNALFEDPERDKAEYLIGSIITNLEVSVCYTNSEFGDFRTGVISAVYLKANWQVFSTLERRVVLDLVSEGSIGEQDDRVDPDTAFALAFERATRNLLADPKFYELVTGSRAAPAQTTVAAPLVVAGLQYDRGRAFNANAVKSSVVMIEVGAGGHGSGFLVTPDGYILTNQHVVGGAERVRVVFDDGKAVVGEVLRRDNARDIALVKVAETGLSSLPLARSEPEVGADVYAIGAPLDRDYQGTVSKGIVSAYRVEQGQRYIQADVNVLPGNSGGPLLDARGNVAGVTVSGVSMMGLSAGLNFFIPIASALQALGIVQPLS
ncbi:MAG: trypsin-like peptidase domain-containing protein [Rhodospirillaceae bacterium]|nr:trypsin-like peptidase domain-containing protein [Rhodospirillaceae bacterium]